ncbi:MAG TPA: glycosyltransferase [Sphingomonas sp.]|nr:glycosyltransferase [Sphingomonas sp.]
MAAACPARPSALHVITGLNVGGAETMLAKLIEQGVGPLEQRVLTLLPPGAIGRRVRRAGADIVSLDLARGFPSPLIAARLMRLVRSADPDLIQGWMYHGNLAASFARLVRPGVPAVWNVRHSLASIDHEKPATRVLLRLSAAISRGADAIIYNSHAAARQHEAIGYSSARTTVIPNGFDCDRFRPRGDAKRLLGDRLGIDPSGLLVGMVARHHPMKDHPSLVRAIARCREAGLDLHLLLVGDGFESARPELVNAIAALPPDRVTQLPARDDVADWLPGLDILALSSAWGEGFPNILGEAMACGVPCVATDVGDSKRILGDAGLSTPASDSEALAAAITILARLSPDERRQMGMRGRARICASYTLKDVASQYAALYDDLLAARIPRERSRP